MLNILFFYFEIIHVHVTQKSQNPSPPQNPLMYLYQIIQSKSDKINPKQILVIRRLFTLPNCVS